MIFGVFVGCVKNNYNVALDSNANQWISNDFLKENMVKSAFYINEDYIEGESDPSDKYIQDTTSPSSRTYIITEEDKFTEIFTEYDSTINFDEKMVILYIFANEYPNRNYKVDKITFNNQMLNINLKLDKKNVNDATAPFQRCLMIILDKLDVEKVKFVY
jgi:hypothetical protein